MDLSENLILKLSYLGCTEIDPDEIIKWFKDRYDLKWSITAKGNFTVYKGKKLLIFVRTPYYVNKTYPIYWYLRLFTVRNGEIKGPATKYTNKKYKEWS